MSSDRSSIEELYAAAVSLPAAQRRDYVLTHCRDTDARNWLLKRLEGATQTVAAADNAACSTTVLQPGTRLGHYLVQKPIGAGGMGQVYEALDESLNRLVAIKVLPTGRYDDSSRARFRREAEAASALNHPNIVTVYEVGREGDIDFIAMERIAGRTLNRVADGRPMPIRKAVEIAIQIADALAVAHDAGIVHRDLKPTNIMVTDRDVVKVLDFGVAKHITGISGQNLEQVTVIGEIVGTTEYMSPEQAEGKSVDARSDIFAFGTLLYRMLTGRMPFQGPTAHATLAAISIAEPEPLRSLRPDAPKLLATIFEKCTRKQPYQRWQHLNDVKLLLQEVLADADSPETARTVDAKANRKWLWYLAAAGLAGAAITAAIQRPWRPAAPPPVSTLRLVTAEQGLSTSPVLSNDGALLAFASDRAGQGNLDIWIQQVGGSEPMRLTFDGSDETDPSFSHDGVKVAYRSEKEGGGVYIVSALGGDPVLAAPGGRNPRFSPDGKAIAFWVGREGSAVPGSSKPFVLDLSGGAPRDLKTQLSWAQYPVWSPDGRFVLVYGMESGGETADWWIVPAGGGQARPMRIWNTVRPLRVRSFPVVLDWYSDGNAQYLLFAPEGGDNSNLWRMGVSADGTPQGSPVRVTNGPGRHVRASLRSSKDGPTRLAFADETLNYDVWRLPVHEGTAMPSGELQPVTDRLTPEMNPSVSGDGRLAYFITARMGGWSLVRKDLESGRERVLHNSPQLLYNARVASDGNKVFFSNRAPDLQSIPADGGVVETLCRKCGSVTGVSPTGDRVLYQPTAGDHLMMFDVASRRSIKLADRGDPHILLDHGQISDDGRFAAFHATNTQTRDSIVYLARIDGALPVPRDRWIQISGDRELARDALFAPSGAFLYYTSEKDGFRCLWARRLHPATRAPQGEPFAVRHFHTSRLGLRNRASSGNIIGLSTGGNYLVFALTEVTGNIWLEETRIGQ